MRLIFYNLILDTRFLEETVKLIDHPKMPPNNFILTSMGRNAYLTNYLIYGVKRYLREIL
jgi:hypothetical protein